MGFRQLDVASTVSPYEAQSESPVRLISSHLISSAASHANFASDSKRERFLKRPVIGKKSQQKKKLVLMERLPRRPLFSLARRSHARAHTHSRIMQSGNPPLIVLHKIGNDYRENSDY
jgi:hypothetical protein